MVEAEVSEVSGVSMTPRWHLVVALLADPIGATRQLVRRLERWRPAAVRRHWLTDDLVRRQWRKGRT